MKEKTRKKLQKRWENLPRHFIDSSVFLELALKQHRDKACMKFFNLVGYKYRIETSSIVMGEIIKRFNLLTDKNTRMNLFLWLENILHERDIIIHTVSESCFNLKGKISKIDNHLGPLDSLIFGHCIENSCNCFVTLDSDFSDKLGKEYKVKIYRLN